MKRYIKTLEGRYERILVIGDLHFPYQHQDALRFLAALKKFYKPDLVISIGDEVDGHGWSYHESDPSLWSAGHEFVKAYDLMQELAALFPDLKVIESNHGSLQFRKQQTAGIPKQFFKSYSEAWGVPWTWHMDMLVQMSDKEFVYLHHGKASDVIKVSQTMGLSAVQGHYHEKMGTRYWASPLGMKWAAQTGCLVDDNSMAMAYNNCNLKRPLLGSLMILDGQPLLEPMLLDRNGRWIGEF